MTDIAKSILTGGWLLVAGWILPTAINVLVFGYFVLPSLSGIPLAHHLEHASAQEQALAVLAVSAVAGLVLNAVQRPFYRVLEGYLLWPGWLARRRRDHYVKVKNVLQKRIYAIYYRGLKNPDDQDRAELARLEADPDVSKYARKDRDLTDLQSALRAESDRYPADISQVAPTRLGNAIRRLETYGSDRFRLDSQVLWYELTAAAPKELSRQIDQAQAAVDFFVCLLYGHVLALVIALASLGAAHAHSLVLLVTAAVLAALLPLWYWLAWMNTDNWAFSVRALVDLGRKPLAEGLSLRLPRELTQEREMWLRYSQFVREPYSEAYAGYLDEFRQEGDTAAQPETPAAETPAGDAAAGQS